MHIEYHFIILQALMVYIYNKYKHTLGEQGRPAAAQYRHICISPLASTTYPHSMGMVQNNVQCTMYNVQYTVASFCSRMPVQNHKPNNK